MLPAPSRSPRSIRTFPREYRLHGLEEVHKVNPDRPVADVPGIHRNTFFVGGVAAPVDLPDSGDARRNHVVFLDVFSVALYLLRHDWARSHETHIAP